MSANDPIALETAESMLSYVRGVDDREIWVKIAYAIKSEFGDLAFEAWDEWSQSGASYSASDAKAVWKSVKPNGKVGIASLIAAAKEGGWKPTDSDKRHVSAEEIAARKAEREARLQAERDQEERDRQSAAEESARMWDAARADDIGHPYAARKQVACIGARRLKDMLLIPMRHGPGALVGLQIIQPDGSRKFKTGTPAAGAYTVLGSPTKTGPIVICEGWATGCSIHMATGWCVVVAFSAGNLEAVAKKIRAALPDARLIMAADDDAFTDGNPGITYATAAATAVDAELAVPRFTTADRGTDFNDLHCSEGIEAVRTCFDGQTAPSNPTGPGAPDTRPTGESPVERDKPASVPAADAANNAGSSAEAFPPPFTSGAAVEQPPVPMPQTQGPAADAKKGDWNIGPAIDVFSQMPAPAIQRGMLPPVIANYAFDQAELIGVDPAMIAMPAIVSCAAALHDGIEIQPKRHETGWRESARLWCAVVGNPSVRKSPSLKRAIGRLKKINKDLCDANERQEARYQGELETWKDLAKEAKKSKELPPVKPEEPAKKRMIVEDVTVEALSEILKHNDRGVMCVQDELTGWFGSMDAYSGGKGANKDRAHWLEIYNGGHRMVDRVMRGNVSIPNWSACMVGGIQPDMIRQVAKNMGEDGLMQRFMVIIGRNSGKEQDRPEDIDAKHAYGALIDYLFGVLPAEDPVTLTEGAHQIREAITDFAADLSASDSIPGGLKSHLGKWAGLFARLTLTYHAIDCAAQGTYPVREKVSVETATRVDALMRDFLLPHALSYYTDVLGMASDLEHVRWIAGHILSKQLQELDARDLMQSYRAWRGLDEWRRARIMGSLEEYGWLVPTTENKPGRKMPGSWIVNSSVHCQFKAIAEQEKARRSAIKDTINELRSLSNNDNK